MNPLTTRLDERNKSFQRTMDESDVKKLREDKSIELRKKKRIENYVKRSRLANNPSETLSEEFLLIPEALTRLDPSLSNPSTSSLSKIRSLARLILIAPDEATLNLEVEQMRKFLSSDEQQPLEALSETELFSKLCFLLEQQNPSIKFNTAWILTNMSSSKNSELLVRLAQTGVIEKLGKLAVEEPAQEYNFQAIWALSNFAGESKEFRDAVLKTGVFSAVIRKINTNSQLELSHLTLYTWFMSNLFKFTGLPSPSLVKDFLNILHRLFIQTNEDVLTETLRSLFYITAEEAFLTDVFNTCMISRVISLCRHDSNKIREQALSTLCHLSTGDEVQVQYLIDNKIFDVLAENVRSDKTRMIKDSLFVLSNVVGQSKRFSTQVIGMNLFQEALEKLLHLDKVIRLEALICVRLCLENAQGVERVLTHKFYGNVLGVLQFNDPDSVLMVLAILEIVFKVVKEREEGLKEFFDVSGMEVLGRLAGHPNFEIYNYAMRLIHEYLEEGESVQNMNPVYYQGVS